MSETFDIYIEETKEHLEIMDESLLQFEKNPQDKELINKIFRAAHTIKGSSAVMGFPRLTNLTHGMEDVLHDIREGKLVADKKIIELLFICHDMIENCLDSIISTGSESDIKIDTVIANLHAIVEEKQLKNEGSKDSTASTSETSGALTLETSDWDKIKQFTAEGYTPYKIEIKLSNECAFKSIASWMIFDRINNIVEIIKSNPDKPTAEEFKSGKFVFNDTIITIFGVSQQDKKDLEDQINSISGDIEKAEVETISNSSVVSLRIVDSEQLAAESAVAEIIGSDSRKFIGIEETFRKEFIEEIKSQLDKAEANLAVIETEPQRNDILKNIFQIFHTIEGLAGFLEIKQANEIASAIGSLTGEYAEKCIDINIEAVNLMLNAIDLFRNICSDVDIINKEEFSISIKELIGNISIHMQNIPSDNVCKMPDPELLKQEFEISFEENLTPNTKRTDRVATNTLEELLEDIKDHLEIIESGILEIESAPENIEYLKELYKEFHTISGLAGFANQGAIREISDATENLLDNFTLYGTSSPRTLIDLLLKSYSLIKTNVEDLNNSGSNYFLMSVKEHINKIRNYSNITDNNKIGDVMIARGILKEQDVDEILKKQKDEYSGMKFGEIALKEKKVKVEDIVESLRFQKDTEPIVSKTQTSGENSFLRVSVAKADSIVDMLGELLIMHSLLEQEASERFNSNDKFMNNLTRMAKTIKLLQNTSLSLRMVSLKSTFQKLIRIGRDTAMELGKKAEIIVSGEDTEIDRNVADKILDPLMHLVRNAISHGLENEDERLSKGKSAEGNVLIKGYSKRGNVYIEITDDGKGLMLDKIYDKAMEKNLINPGYNYSREEIIKFIFLPGFSTMETVNNISGRGVGMNVVETEITKIGGKVEVVTEEGKGSTFILKIPINFAVMNGTITNILGSRYIVPTVYIKEISSAKAVQWISYKGNRNMIRLRDEIIPVIPIKNIFGNTKEEKENDIQLLIIVEIDRKLKAIPVFSIIGKQEIVIKPLGNEFKEINFISGASILGDGKVTLILDIETLFKIEEN